MAGPRAHSRAISTGRQGYKAVTTDNVGKHGERLSAGSRPFFHEVAKAAASGAVRIDMPAQELASFSVHALTAAADIEAAPAVESLVDLVWAAMTAASSC